MAETGFDMPASEAAAEAAVAALGAAPPPSARRQLAALFSGSGDISSALVQWLRLPPGERRAGDGVSVALAGKLDALAGRKNENYLIAAALAARLGLDLAETLAVGDGANDLAMIEAAGLGVAYRAKPVVAARADARVDHADLTALLYFQGYAAEDFA